jgi:hypothetical protein
LDPLELKAVPGTYLKQNSELTRFLGRWKIAIRAWLYISGRYFTIFCLYILFLGLMGQHGRACCHLRNQNYVLRWRDFMESVATSAVLHETMPDI